MAKWLITALIVICMTSAYAATLIDSEDFESYDAVPLGYGSLFNWTQFFNESPKWSCFYGSEPVCAQLTGGGDVGYALTIYKQYNDNFLFMAASGGGESNYYLVGLQWNPINTTATANATYTLQFDMQYIGNYGDFDGITTGRTATIAGVSGWGSLWSPGTHIAEIGGVTAASVPSYESFVLLRTSTNATQHDPIFSSCNISDGNWHRITQYFTMGSTCKYTLYQTYIDGVLCHSIACPNTQGYTCGNQMNPILKFRTARIFAMAFDNINIYQGMANATAWSPSYSNTTVCDSFTLPYYLKESFNGRLYQCNWSASNNDFYYGELFVQNNTFFYAQKDFASPVDGTLLSKDSSRYATISYDLSLLGSESGENWELRLYDSTNKNIFTIYTDANSYYYVSNAAGVWLGNLSTSTYNWKVVIDLVSSKADIYLNDVLLEDDATMAIGFYNVMNLKRIKVASANVEFTMDNLHIYSSDASGLPQLPDVAIVPGVTDNDTMMCGLMYRNASACNQDSDCITGECMPTGRCSQFDWTYCDEHGKFRGNYCYFSAIASCGGKNVSSIIFDNFLWVLVAIVILMGVVYLSIMVRRR